MYFEAEWGVFALVVGGVKLAPVQQLPHIVDINHITNFRVPKTSFKTFFIRHRYKNYQTLNKIVIMLANFVISDFVLRSAVTVEVDSESQLFRNKLHHGKNKIQQTASFWTFC